MEDPTKLKPPAAAKTTGDPIDGRFVAGTVLADRYRITGLLGIGGMGEVYKAEDIKLGQTVALKFLPDELERDPAALERFHHEVRTARQVSHRNVCRVFDIAQSDGRSFLSMEYIHGDDLASLLKRIGRLPSDKAIAIARELCFGLAAIHECGILHRDLKPANVIIDDRGRARITDFGIAGFEHEFKPGESRAGTPAYMAPEQITGNEATVRSDIYSLGLLLYEIFTGKRVFESDSLTELARRHKTTSPTTPSELVPNIDPLVEQAISRCLETDPAGRPASALHVARALPGGDPLQMAIEAGETPSPEMVAAAPKQGVLSPAVAAVWLVAVLGAFAFIVLMAKVKLHEWAPLEKSPEALAELASQIRSRAGYRDAPTDTAYAFGVDIAYLAFSARDRSPNRFERFRTGQPLSYYFWHRSSPRYMVPFENGKVDLVDPPVDVSGMSTVILDPRGRLVKFEAVPSQTTGGNENAPATDWSTLFADAGLDLRNYSETGSQWTPLFFADERRAWQGPHIDHPDIPVRIEAASYAGKPVYFQVIAPWDEPQRETVLAGTSARAAAGVLLTVAFFVALVIAIFVARHNLKLGRADTKGGLRLLIFVFCTVALAGLIGSDHVPELGAELFIFFQIASLALFLAGLVWLFYVAVEPFIRKRWPELIISWSRLLAGDLRDPMVGRDVLIGGFLGLTHTVVIYFMVLLPEAMNIPVAPNAGGDPETLMGVSGLAVYTLNGLAMPAFLTVAPAFLLLLLLAIFRRKWLAVGALWLLVFVAEGLAFASNGPVVRWIAPALIAFSLVFSLTRYGLLALYSYFFFWVMTFHLILTANLSSWYARNTIFSFVVVMALAIYGFYTAIAGQPLIKTGDEQS